jgi:hypothetical protein
MKNSKGYTLVGLAMLVSVLVVGTISIIGQLVSGGKSAQEVAASEVDFTQSRAESILATIRDARGR